MLLIGLLAGNSAKSEKDGKIHAAGTHRQLLAEDPIYQEIYASQMKEDEHHAGPSAQRQKA